MNPDRFAFLLLRLAIAFAFLYPPIDAIFHPEVWIGFFPPLLVNNFPPQLLLDAWGVIEVVVALWILSGRNILIPSIIAMLMLCGIVVFNLPAFDIVFRDIALALVCLTLAWMSYQERVRSTK